MSPTSPRFLLCRNDHHVLGHGSVRAFTSPDQAASALRSGDVAAVVGALPFDLREPAALTAPEALDVAPGPWNPPTGTTLAPGTRIGALEPSLATHHQRVASAVTALADRSVDLQKVVLARAVSLCSQQPVSPWELAAALRADDPEGSVFLADLEAGGRSATLVGASPEVLIRKKGRHVSAHPLAGSAARSSDPTVDRQRGAILAGSVKDLTEHRYVVTAIADALAPLCTDLDVPEQPSVMATPAMWHLGTPIRGVIDDPSITALDLALAIHPTPAICGTPTTAARDHILATEGSRGFYAGAVGWARAGSDDDPETTGGGDGEWMVSIRCAEVAGHGRATRTWAGGGIVADSDPQAEVAETQAKLATILRAFGISPL